MKSVCDILFERDFTPQVYGIQLSMELESDFRNIGLN